jgi:uncharacterized protein (TIGR03086 family)
MALETTPLLILSSALDQTAELIAGIRSDQAALPTPCASWSVRDLVAHVVNDLDKFTTATRGETPDWSRPPKELGSDWGGAFQAGRERLLAEWERADLEGLVPAMGGGELPLISRADPQIAECGVHAWDIARATGQQQQLDPAVAAHGLEWAKGMLRAEFRGAEHEGKSFGPEVPVPDDAPIYDRLAGWFGRDPHWSASSG